MHFLVELFIAAFKTSVFIGILCGFWLVLQGALWVIG